MGNCLICGEPHEEYGAMQCVEALQKRVAALTADLAAARGALCKVWKRVDGRVIFAEWINDQVLLAEMKSPPSIRAALAAGKDAPHV